MALDLSTKQVLVVEVSSGYNLDTLTARVRDRESRWYRPIGKYLSDAGIVDSTWRIRTVVFIREELTRTDNSWAEGQVHHAPDVTFIDLEQITLPYKWHKWRVNSGIPGQQGATTIPDAPAV